jgi:hypothetical protein
MDDSVQGGTQQVNTPEPEAMDDYNPLLVVRDDHDHLWVHRVAGKLAANVRLTTYIKNHDQANVAVVREKLDHLRIKYNIRFAVWEKVQPLAVKYCFVETRQEREARLFTMSEEYQSMYHDTYNPLVRESLVTRVLNVLLFKWLWIGMWRALTRAFTEPIAERQ